VIKTCKLEIKELEEQEFAMGISEAIKKNWIAIQKKNSVPVNAIGVKIGKDDEKTLKIWQDEGIDKFLKS
jgi:hypothetical protein